MRIDLLSIFPEYFAPLGLSLLGRAEASGLLDVRVHDLRTWAHDRHRSVDDTPYGGGAGMVMMPSVWGEALDSVLDDPAAPSGRTVLAIPTPSGTPLTQALAADLAGAARLLLACGRYEGIDQRLLDAEVDEELSIGDFVVSGGELPALALVDAVVRLLPGVMTDDASALHDSFSDGLLEGPHYTRPEHFAGVPVPPVLMSGHHARITRWRREQALRATADRRPELIEQARREGRLSGEDEAFLRGLS